mgnify:FL=1
MAFYATAKVEKDLCGEEFDIEIYEFRERMFSDYNQRPNPVPRFCRNYFRHAAQGGDRIWLMWKEIHPDDTEEQVDEQSRAPVSEWVIIDVEKHQFDVVTDVYWKEGTGGGPSCLMRKSVRAALEVCAPPVEATIICAVECP